MSVGQVFLKQLLEDGWKNLTDYGSYPKQYDFNYNSCSEFNFYKYKYLNRENVSIRCKKENVENELVKKKVHAA